MIKRSKRDNVIKRENQKMIFDPLFLPNRKLTNEERRRFFAVPHVFLISPQVLDLSDKAFRLLIYMKDYAMFSDEFIFPKSMYDKICCNSTFQKAKKELIEKGFIIEKANGKFSLQPNIYEFSGNWKNIDIKSKTKRRNNFPKSKK